MVDSNFLEFEKHQSQIWCKLKRGKSSLPKIKDISMTDLLFHNIMQTIGTNNGNG